MFEILLMLFLLILVNIVKLCRRCRSECCAGGDHLFLAIMMTLMTLITITMIIKKMMKTMITTGHPPWPFKAEYIGVVHCRGDLHSLAAPELERL